MNSLTKRFFTVLVFVFTTLISTSTFATLDQNLGIGLDIIQGKSQTEYWVTGESCGITQIFIYDENDNLVLSSPVFDEAEFEWLIDAANWAPGTYDVYAQSANCTLQETLNL